MHLSLFIIIIIMNVASGQSQYGGGYIALLLLFVFDFRQSHLFELYEHIQFDIMVFILSISCCYSHIIYIYFH